MVFKVILVRDIIYVDGVIQNINGISFKKNEIVLERDIYDFQTNFTPYILIEKKLMADTWEKYLEKRSGRIITFLFAIFCYVPVIPDIIATRILYKKIKFPYFIIAAIIGKGITHIPFIFLGKTVVQLLNIKI